MLQGDALVEAAAAGDLAKVQALIAKGAPLNYKCSSKGGHHNMRPLHFAASNGHAAVVEALLRVRSGRRRPWLAPQNAAQRTHAMRHCCPPCP